MSFWDLEAAVTVTDEKKYLAAGISVGLIHVVLAVIFYIMGHGVLSLVGLGCALLTGVLANLAVSKKNYTAGYFVLYADIFLHSIFMSLAFGVESGFIYYNLGLVPISFFLAYTNNEFKQNIALSLWMNVLNVIITVSTMIAIYIYNPIAIKDEVFYVFILHQFNVTVCFIMVLMFCVLFVLEMMTAQKALREQNVLLEELAKIDPLTKLNNRRSMELIFNENFKECDEKFCVILGDIDNFKLYNDEYGHDFGDMVLVEIADILKKNIGKYNEVCRWGGEEIMSIVKMDRESAVELIDSIRKEIEEKKFVYCNIPIYVTMTFGVAEYVEGSNLEHIIHRADTYMYQGKRAGKNCVITGEDEWE